MKRLNNVSVFKAFIKVRLVDQKVNRPIYASQGSKMNGEESMLTLGIVYIQKAFMTSLNNTCS